MRRDQLQMLRMIGAGILALGTMGWAGDSACAKDSPRAVQRDIRETSWGSGSVRLRPLKRSLRPLQSDRGRTGRSAQRLMREMRWIKLTPEESARTNAVTIHPRIPRLFNRDVQLGQKIQRITVPQIRRLSQRQVQVGRSAKSLSRSKGYTLSAEAAATGRHVTNVVRDMNKRPRRPTTNPLAGMVQP